MLVLLLPGSYSISVFAASCNSDNEALCQIEIEIDKSAIKRTSRPIQRISVANPAIVDYHLITPQQILLIPKQTPGSTNLIVWYNEYETEIFDVYVYNPTTSEEAIRKMLQKLVPEANIRLAGVGPVHSRRLILDGDVESQQTLDRVLTLLESFVMSPKNIVNMITVKGLQQVQLEVKIAEISRSGMKQMGMGFLLNKDWNVGVFPSGTFEGSSEAGRSNTSGVNPQTVTTAVYDQSTGNYTYTTKQLGEGENVVTQDIASAISIGSPFASAFQLALHAVKGDVMSIISVLKGQNLARVLAKPTLVAMTGQEAEFLVGGEFPIPVSGENGNTNIQFVQYGIMLRFTPTILGKEEILLKVEPEVSSPDYSLAVFSGGVSVPGLKTRRGRTTLQLKDGQSFAIAGLLKEDMYTSISKIPFFGDIPYLGALFTSKQFEKQETELVVIVTPHIVKPLNPDEIPPLPGENMEEIPTDFDFFIRNRFQTKDTARKIHIDEASAPVFVGGIGYSR